MPDFVITGSSSAPQFNPSSLGKGKNGTLTTINNTNGTVNLNILQNGMTTAKLFTSGVSSLSIPVGDQTLGTISNNAGDYDLVPASQGGIKAGIGNNVKINVGTSGDVEEDEEANEEEDDDAKP